MNFRTESSCSTATGDGRQDTRCDWALKIGSQNPVLTSAQLTTVLNVGSAGIGAPYFRQEQENAYSPQETVTFDRSDSFWYVHTLTQDEIDGGMAIELWGSAYVTQTALNPVTAALELLDMYVFNI